VSHERDELALGDVGPLQFLEQLRVDDGRRGVLGQARDEIQVEQVQRAVLVAFQQHHADHLPGADQRHSKLGHAAGQRLAVVGVERQIGDERGPGRAHDAAQHALVVAEGARFRAGRERRGGRVPVGHHHAQRALHAVAHEEGTGRRPTLAQRPVHHDVHHAPQVERAV